MTPEEKEKLEEAAAFAIEAMKRRISEDVIEGRAESLGPQVLLVSTRDLDGTEHKEPAFLFLTPTLMPMPDGSIPNKRLFMGLVKGIAAKMNAYAAAIGMEAWHSRLDESEIKREDLPTSMEDWPEDLRCEAALVMFEKPGFYQMHIAEIERDDIGTTLAEWESAEPDRTEGRMTHIIPANFMS